MPSFLNYLCSPSLDSLRCVNIFSVLGTPELDPALQAGTHQWWVEWEDPLPHCAGNTPNAAQDAIGLLCSKTCLTKSLWFCLRLLKISNRLWIKTTAHERKKARQQIITMTEYNFLLSHSKTCTPYSKKIMSLWPKERECCSQLVVNFLAQLYKVTEFA